MISKLLLNSAFAQLLPQSLKTKLVELFGQRPALVYVKNTPKLKRIN